MFTLLTSPDAIAQPTLGKRFFVELASNALDEEGIPEYFKIIDVCVTDEGAGRTHLVNKGSINGFIENLFNYFALIENSDVYI